MSIDTLCDRFTVTIERYATTRGDSGQAKKTFSQANRTSAELSTSIRADLQTLSAEERAEYGIESEVESWRMYTATDPKLTAQDRVIWTDNSSTTRTCTIQKPSTDSAGRGRLWKTIVIENKTTT